MYFIDRGMYFSLTDVCNDLLIMCIKRKGEIAWRFLVWLVFNA